MDFHIGNLWANYASALDFFSARYGEYISWIEGEYSARRQEK
jgi:hypothetical protein